MSAKFASLKGRMIWPAKGKVMPHYSGGEFCAAKVNTGRCGSFREDPVFKKSKLVERKLGIYFKIGNLRHCKID